MAGLEIGTAKAVAEAAIELIGKAQKQGWLDNLVTALRRKPRILVLGATGTGKTAFVESLIDNVPKAIDPMNRTQFVEQYRIKISKEPFIFIDTPGQIRHARRRRQAIKEALNVQNGVAGIINVVSFGYHEASTVSRPAINAAGKVAESFLSQQRRVETALLDEWTELLGADSSVQWLITVVTKADLWWKRQEEALEHYRSGDYYRKLGDAQLLKPVVLEYCAVFQKFYSQGLMSGVYQDSDRIRAKAQIIRALLAAIGREHHA